MYKGAVLEVLVTHSFLQRLGEMGCKNLASRTGVGICEYSPS